MADMFPLRVLVENVRPQHCLSCAHDGQPILDTFAILSGQTQLSQLVDTVLSALGMPQLIQDSKGLIQLNNWKPLPFESITDNQDELVANLIKDISGSLTLKILVSNKHASADGQQSSQCIAELKQRLLKLAIDKQPHILTTLDNQEVKEAIQQVIASGDENSLTAANITAINEWLDQLGSGSNGNGHGADRRKSPLSASASASVRFNQLSETPRLDRWFRSEPNPSRQKLLSYIHILNAAPYRRSNAKVTYQQICNWFANQRAANRSSGGPSRPASQASHVPTTTATTMKGGVLPKAQLPSFAGPLVNSSSASGGMDLASFNNFMLMSSLGLSPYNNNGGSGTKTDALRTSFPALFGGGGDNNGGGTEVDVASHLPMPLSKMPMDMDIQSKFNTPSGSVNFGAMSAMLLERMHGDAATGLGLGLLGGGEAGIGGTSATGERIDGGSESPNGNDDASVRSASDAGADHGDNQQAKESGASSPDHHSFMGDSPRNARQQPATTTATSNNANNNSITAATAAAFSSLMPTMSLMNSAAFMNSSGGAAAAAAALAAACAASPLPNNNNNERAMDGFLRSTPTTTAHHHNQRGEQESGEGEDEEQEDPTSGHNPQSHASTPSSSHPNGHNASAGGSTARSRLMFDPLTELPILERWFEQSPHPGWLQIEQFTDTLNSLEYRRNYPPISNHNVKIWFKNRRAKCKRLTQTDSGKMLST